MIFSQAPGGTRPAGFDVADGAVGNPVTVTNADDTDVASWTLNLFAVPRGPEADSTSALLPAVIASGAAPPIVAAFTPDCFGAFMLNLTITGTDGSIVNDYASFQVPNERGWSKPGFKQAVGSSKFGGQLLGWTYNTDKIQRDARVAALKSNKLKQEHAFVDGIQQTDQTSFVVVGGRRFNPADFAAVSAGISRVITFRAEAFATPGMTAQVRLFNFTDGVQVASTVLSTASNTPAALTAVLTVPTDLPNANKLYEAQLRISAGIPTPTDRAFLLYAGLDVSLEG